MSNIKNSNQLLIKIYKREINTEVLYNAMQKMQNNSIIQQTKSIKKEEFLEKMNNLKEKVEIKVNVEKYETIQENLNESLKIMKELNKNFKELKKNSINIEVQVKNEDIKIDKADINILNVKNKYYQDNKVMDEILEEKYDKIKDINEKILENKQSLNKSILDIEWLQPFLDFMNNHSTILLTIGSGLVMGGMWYMNNVGFINIGSLLTRLGIQIFSPTAQNSQNLSAPSITLSSETPRVNQIGTVTGGVNDATEIGRGFFRQLGEKVLKLIDALIVKIESKQQKYK
jgi:hypothetical protein